MSMSRRVKNRGRQRRHEPPARPVVPVVAPVHWLARWEAEREDLELARQRVEVVEERESQ
jgi:hypothetical protein